MIHATLCIYKLFHYVIDCLKEQTIAVNRSDIKRRLQYIFKNPNDETKNDELREIFQRLDSELLASQIHAYEYQARNFIDAVYKKRACFKTDQFSGRIHSKFTNMCGFLRSYLKHEGEFLVEYDVKAAQMGSVLVNTLNMCKSLIECEDVTYDTLRKIKNKDAELTKFGELVKDGSIYNVLGKAAGISDRNEAKVATYTYIFANSNNKVTLSYEARKIAEAVEKLFPAIAECMYILKSKHYSCYAQHMQSHEKHVISKILDAIPDSAFKITIHDAILLSASQHEDLAPIIAEVIEKEFLGFAALKVNSVRSAYKWKFNS